MGTPEFAVAPLKLLLENGFNISAVITAPDKPCGRGLKVAHSPVYLFAKEKGLKILQPVKLKDENFINELSEINPDLQIVVAFRMLPEAIWKLPKIGTFNLHASLLPQYRGAAPINRAIMNGETKTGVTTFFINENIDTGNILLQQETPINPDETAGELHDKLMNIGSDLVLKTVQMIENGNIKTIPQNKFVTENIVLNNAPKIFSNDCKINWNAGIDSVFNHIRGLSPYPAAHTELISPEGTPYYIKVFRCTKRKETHNYKTGKILTDRRTQINVAVPGGFINLVEIQLHSKKKMTIPQFLCGFPIDDNWSVNLI